MQATASLSGRRGSLGGGASASGAGEAALGGDLSPYWGTIGQSQYLAATPSAWRRNARSRFGAPVGCGGARNPLSAPLPQPGGAQECFRAMSAICGLIDFSAVPADPAVLFTMAAAAGRRGPGRDGYQIVGEAGLWHHATHVTSETTQPICSADGAIHLVADVRLDNRAELISILKGDGFLTQGNALGDAELILAAYLRWEESCPERLLGDFAFAIWDVRRRRLLLACDPLGMKPLHYSRNGSCFVFASEAQQVLQHPAVPRRLDEITVADYLAGCYPEPGRTFFRDVHQLAPAHRLIITQEGERIDRYWDLDPEHRITFDRDEEYASCFLELFSQTVESRLRTQASCVGVLMSGGLDSCSVAAAARRNLPAEGPIRLFTGSFTFDQLRQCDESANIQAVSAHLSLEADVIKAEQFPIFGPATMPSLETPFQAWEGCFQELLRRAQNRGTGVLLTGHGGDDLLSGSPSVYADRLRRGDFHAVAEVVRHARSKGPAWLWVIYHYLARPLLPRLVNRILARLPGRSPESAIPNWIDPALVLRTSIEERTVATPPRHFGEAARQVLYSHFRQAPWAHIVHWYDRNAAPFGIEVRHPFLDRRLIEFLFSIPPAKLFRAGHSKPLLREAARGLMPKEVLLRLSKRRVGAFLDHSLREQKTRIKDLLMNAPLAVELGFLDGERLRLACRSFLEGGNSEAQRPLWYAISLENWLRFHGTCLDLRPLPPELRSAA